MQAAVKTTSWLMRLRKTLIGRDNPTEAQVAKWDSVLGGATARLECVLGLNPALRRISDADPGEVDAAAADEVRGRAFPLPPSLPRLSMIVLVCWACRGRWSSLFCV